MVTRYQQLREAIAILAAPADVQNAALSKDGLDALHGSDELALMFDDIYKAVGDMRDRREISQEEIEAAKPLNALLEKWSGEQHADFWQREALWQDARWEQVRQCAREVLSHYSDEEPSNGLMED